ncbi:hypothetical protein SLA2020_453170 [Shorea laevis]
MRWDRKGVARGDESRGERQRRVDEKPRGGARGGGRQGGGEGGRTRGMVAGGAGHKSRGTGCGWGIKSGTKKMGRVLRAAKKQNHCALPCQQPGDGGREKVRVSPNMALCATHCRMRAGALDGRGWKGGRTRREESGARLVGGTVVCGRT